MHPIALRGAFSMKTIRTTFQHNAHRKGWTFIELLTTISILSIAALVLIPSASSGASVSGQSATRHIVTDILAAQMDAVAQQEYRRIHFFADGSGWCVEVLDASQLATSYSASTAEYADDASESQGQGQTSFIDFAQDTRYKNMSITSALFDASTTSIIFDQTGGIVAPDGSPSTGGSFELHSSDHIWQVQLAPLTGKLTVAKIGGGS